MNKNTIQKAIDSALHFLTGEQQSSGSFVSCSSPEKDLSSEVVTYSTTLTPSLILSSLTVIDTETSRIIRDKIAHFLLNQKSAHWSFNYWERSSAEAKTLPYPDDLDDTFCALSALHLHNPRLVDETALAHMTKVLIATESNPGGPYRTWLASKNATPEWKDIDLAVNANIAYFLSLIASSPPPLTAYLEDAIKKEEICSPYYPSAFPILYFLGRAQCNGSNYLVPLLDSIRDKDEGWGSPLKTALSCSTLLHLDRKPSEKVISLLLNAQNPDGSWPAEAFCIDPSQNGRPYYSGSKALTTALVIEALQRYSISSTRSSKLKGQISQTPFLARAKHDLKPFKGDSLYESAVKQASLVAKSRNGLIITKLPQLFNDSLISQPILAPSFFEALGLANLYGWAGYTILDDILDNETGTQLLPTAHFLTRRSLQLFLEIHPEDAAFRDEVYASFNEMDAANAWELSHARFVTAKGKIKITNLPPYKADVTQLAERSSGHTLPVLGVLATLNISLKSKEATYISKALRHYISARQISDDAHDWKEDFHAGRITYVVAMILRELSINPGLYDANSLAARMEKQFWNHTLPAICQIISKQTTLSRKAITRSGLLKSPHFLEIELERIDAATRDTLQSVEGAKRFLKAYQEN